MRPDDFGTSPVWRATGDGVYAIPAGFRCIGFMATVAGTVGITSAGVAITPTVLAGVQYSGQVDSFQAGTATGVYAFLVKG